MADNVIERAEMKDYSLTHNILTQSSGTVTLDMSTGNSFFFVLTENAIIAITNPPPSGKLGQLIARIKQDGAGGGFTVTWAASVEWAGGSKPTQSVGNDAVDKYTLTTDDAATSFFGEFGQAYGNA